jgi:hypothetical protein
MLTPDPVPQGWPGASRARCRRRRTPRPRAAGRTRLLPADVDHHLGRLGELGFSERWVTLESDLWILVFATHPDIARGLFDDQAQALTDPALRQLYLDYDRAHGLDSLIRDGLKAAPGGAGR